MSTKNRLTAVEWLDMEINFLIELYPSEYKNLNKLINQAKEKEKQQIIDAFNDASLEGEKMGTIYYETEFKK